MIWIAEMPTGKRVLDSLEAVRDCLENKIRVYRVMGLSLETPVTLAISEREEAEDRRFRRRFG